MTEQVEVAIVGAGQAGLATSWYLTQAGVEHVVLEAGTVAETWRSRRWNSFRLVTPNWSVQLPGAGYAGPDPDGFMVRDELVAHIASWAQGFAAPVREGCAVGALDVAERGFELQTSSGVVRARRVVVASGGYQRAHVPAGARGFPPNVLDLLAEDYRNPDGVPPGAVLIIGSGQTGCQLAEELREAGRRVIVSCGRCQWAPRRMGGHDLVWWLVETGWWDRTPADLPSPAARFFGNPQATGHHGGRDLNYRTLHAAGIEMVDRFTGTEDGIVHFGGDLTATIAAGDAMSAGFHKRVGAFCEKHGLDPVWEMPPPLRLESPTEIDLAREGIGTVIWTAGYRPDYGWVHVPVFDEMGFPVQVDGRCAVDGLYFMGVHFQRRARSAVLYGVGEDAEMVAQHIVESRS